MLHLFHLWPCCLVVYANKKKDLSRDVTCVFNKITVCIVFVTFLQMLVLNVLVMS